jgi:hypothetical protein
MTELYAKIYVGGERERVESLLALALNADVAGQGHTLEFGPVAVDVRRNEDYDPRRFAATYDAFIFAPTYLDVTAEPAVTREAMVEATRRILEALWTSKLIAVAAADFEDELPHRGGVEVLKHD